MNRVFVSGRIEKVPNVAYTPRGERIYSFPLRIEEGAFTIDVIYKDPSGRHIHSGASAVVSGALEKIQVQSKNAFRINANTILLTEE